MKFLKNISICAAVCSIFLSSCKKETDDFVPYITSDFSDTTWASNAISNTKSNAMITALSKTPSTAIFNATNSLNADLDGNTQLLLPANAYVLNGNNYTGNVNASLNAVLTKGDFVRNLISSTNNNPLQETVTAFNLTLKTDAQETLNLKSTNKFSLNYANGNFPGIGFQYYYGTTATEGGIVWNVIDSNSGNLQITNVTIQGNTKLAYQINSNKLGWMIINKQLNLGNTTNCNVFLPINFTNKNTAVFAVFKTNNIVIRLMANANSKSFVGNNLPIGAAVTIVALSYLDNQFYLGYTTTSISNNAQYNIKTTTTPISLNSLNSFLDGL